MKLNLNQEVLLRETDAGRAAFERHYRDRELIPDDYRRGFTQPDGRMQMPLWQLAKIYGDAFVIGTDPPVEMDVEVLATQGVAVGMLDACRTARCCMAELTRFYVGVMGNMGTQDFHKCMDQLDAAFERAAGR